MDIEDEMRDVGFTDDEVVHVKRVGARFEVLCTVGGMATLVLAAVNVAGITDLHWAAVAAPVIGATAVVVAWAVSWGFRLAMRARLGRDG